MLCTWFSHGALRIVQFFFFLWQQQSPSSSLPNELEKIKTWSLTKQHILLFNLFWAEGFDFKKISKYIKVVVERGSSMFWSLQPKYKCPQGTRKYHIKNSFYLGHRKAFICYDCHCWLELHLWPVGGISILLPSSSVRQEIWLAFVLILIITHPGIDWALGVFASLFLP